MTCENGHENPDGRHFCGECGTPIPPAMAICAHGHRNPGDQHFCGECGAPLAAPTEAGSSSLGRWAVDPTGRHQYRYLDAGTLTEHVADTGTVSTDPPPSTTPLYPEKWIGVLAGVVILVLLGGAISAIATQFSGKDDPPPIAIAQSEAAGQAPNAAVPPRPETPEPAPTTTAARLAAVIGTRCLPNSHNGVAADGSVAYCARLQDSSTYMWSQFPGDISSSITSGGEDPSIAVCMSQTARSKTQCVAYLQRPNDPGDGLG